MLLTVELLKEGPSQDPNEEDLHAPLDDQSSEKEDDPWLFCKVCDEKLARLKDAVSIGGQKEHSFSNPGGYVFRIGCFLKAPGALAVGTATTEFTWFAGYSWQICVCLTCASHVGWYYRSVNLESGGSGFFGLVLKQLL